MFGLKVLFVLFPLALVSSEGLIFNHHKINQNQPEARTERFILSKRCQNGDSNDDARERYIRFSSNHTYVYDVQISNEVSAILNRTDSPRRIDETLITINGQAKLSPLNPCEVSLRLEPVKIHFFNNPFDKIDEEIKLYQRQFREPIVFAYKDGIITEIYSPITEHQVEPFVINVKKSIISALQTMPNILNMKEKSSTQKVIETDYFGDCETDYEIDIAKDQSKISVRKQKDLLKCSNLEESAEFSDLGDLVKEFKKAKAMCRQQIEENHIIKSECRSSRSMSSLVNGFNLELVSKINLVQNTIEKNDQHDEIFDEIVATSEKKNHKESKTNSILSNHKGWLRNIYGLTKNPSTKSNGIHSFDGPNTSTDLSTVVEQICKEFHENNNRIAMNSLDSIGKLIRSLRTSTSDQIESVWMMIKQNQTKTCHCENNKKLRDIFVDAASSLLTDGTVSIVKDEMQRLNRLESNDILARNRLRYLATTLAFATSPSSSAIKQLLPEFLTQTNDSQIILSLSSLLKLTTNENIVQDDDVRAIKKQSYEVIVEKIVELISGKSTDQTRVNNPKTATLVRLFKSLENVSPGTRVEEQEKLLPIISGQQYSNEWVRLSAIKSIQGVTTTDVVRQTLMSIFANVTETNEIRIGAYRTLIQTGTNVDELRKILSVIIENQSNQNIYNYVTSHQKILRTTNDLPKRFSIPENGPIFPEPNSMLKLYLSRHFEYEYIEPRTSLGSFAEIDVIMPNTTDDVWTVPRSINLNLTVAISNTKQWNVGELMIRQEGFDGPLVSNMVEKFSHLFSSVKDDQQKQQQHQGQDQQVLFRKLKTIADKMVRNDRLLIGDGHHNRKLQLTLNIDGKNVFVYDSDERTTIGDVWNKLKEKLPIEIDETMIVLPWQKHLVLEQTSSGVPIHLQLNTTWILSMQGFFNQTQENQWQMMLKPTVLTRNTLSIDNYHWQQHDRKEQQTKNDEMIANDNNNNNNGFQLVNQIWIAPTISMIFEIEKNQHLRMKWLLPETEQVWWRSETKILHQQLESQNEIIGGNRYQDLKRFKITNECSPMMLKYIGASLCFRHLDNRKETFNRFDRSYRSQSIEKAVGETILDYSELVIQKQSEQIEGVLIELILPEQFIAPISQSNFGDENLRFGFNLATILNTDETKVNAHFVFDLKVPSETQDDLMAEFSLGHLENNMHGSLIVSDRNAQRSIKMKITDQNNRPVLVIDIDGQTSAEYESTIKNLMIHFSFTPFAKTKSFDSVGIVRYENNGNRKTFELTVEQQSQTVLDFTMKQTDDNHSKNFKSDIETKLKLFGLKVEHHNRLERSPRQFHLVGETRYKRFWSPKANGWETLNLDFNINNGERYSDPERNWHLRLSSSELSSINLDATLKARKQANHREDNFLLKYGDDFERNQFYYGQTIKTMANQIDRDLVRWETFAAVWFKPKNFNYTMELIVDSEPSKQQGQTKNINLMIHNGDSLEKIFETEYHLERSSPNEPMQWSLQGEISVPHYDLTIQHRETFKQIQTKTFRGKSDFTLKGATGMTDGVWKWIPRRYSSVNLFETDQDRIQNLNDLVRHFRQFKHQSFFENDQIGHWGNLVELRSNENGYEYTTTMKREGEQIYDLQGKINYRSKRNFSFDINGTVEQAKVNGVFDWNSNENLLRFHFVANKNDAKSFQIDLDGKNFQLNYQIQNETNRSQNYSIVYDNRNDEFQTKFRNDKFLLKIIFENVFKTQSPTNGLIEFDWFEKSISHQTEMRKEPKSQQWMIKSQTKNQFGNLFGIDYQSKSQTKSFTTQIGNDMIGKMDWSKNLDNSQTLLINMESPHTHQTIMRTEIRWQSLKSSSLSNRSSPFRSIKLLRIKSKNHLKNGLMLDLDYDRDQNDPISSHRLAISSNNFESSLNWSKSIIEINLKAKSNGNWYHQSKIDIEQYPLIRIVSETMQNHRKIFEIDGEIQTKFDQEERQINPSAVGGENRNDSSRLRIKSGEESDQKIVEIFYRTNRMLQMKLLRKNSNQTQPKSIANIEWERIPNKIWTLMIEMKGEKAEPWTVKMQSKAKKSLQFEAKLSTIGSFQINRDIEHRIFDFDLHHPKSESTIKSSMSFNDKHWKFDWKNREQQHRFESKTTDWNDFEIDFDSKQSKKFGMNFSLRRNLNAFKSELDARFNDHQINAHIDHKHDRDHSIDLEASYREDKSNRKKLFQLKHQNQSKGFYRIEMQLLNDQMNLFHGKLELDHQQNRPWIMIWSGETDLKSGWKYLNSKAKIEHQFDGDQKNWNDFRQKGFVEIGDGNEKKSIKISGRNDRDSIGYEAIVDNPKFVTKTIKFEWKKPAKILQINVYDDINGRLIDLNVDLLSKSIQKKFQLFSFDNRIPTIDFEADFGENSHIVFAVGSKSEKKLEMAMNWFGQWRKDYRAEILFKLLAEPRFEVMIVSHHPASYDRINAVFKSQDHTIKAKLSNQFEEQSRWNRQAILEIDDHKTIQLDVEQSSRQDRSNTGHEIVLYDTRLDGDWKARSKIEMILDRSDTIPLKLIRLTMNEFESKQMDLHLKDYLAEFYLRYRQRMDAPKLTGITVEKDFGKQIFALTYVESPMNESDVINTVGHLQLPGGIDYTLVNEFFYDVDESNHHSDQGHYFDEHRRIKQIQSELKRKETVEPLARMQVFYQRETSGNFDENLKSVRLEIESSKFFQPNPKVIEFFFRSQETRDNCPRSHQIWSDIRNDCSTFQMVFGDRFDAEQKPFAITWEHQPEQSLDGRTFLLALETLNEPNKMKALNFTIAGEISSKSIGYKLINLNRFGTNQWQQMKLKSIPYGTMQNETRIKFDWSSSSDLNSGYHFYLDPNQIGQSIMKDAKWNLWPLIESILEPKIPHSQQLSNRSDVSKWKNSIVEGLIAEIHHKLSLLKAQTLFQDLFDLIGKELNEIKHRMKTSNDLIALKLIEWQELGWRNFKNFLKKYDLETMMMNLLDKIVEIWTDTKRLIVDKAQDKCYEYSRCQKMIESIRENDLHRLVRKHLDESMERLRQNKMMPQIFLQVLDSNNLNQNSNTNWEWNHNDEMSSEKFYNITKIVDLASNWIRNFSSTNQNQQQSQSKWMERINQERFGTEWKR
ncbi:hypothetical protein NH340_JMT06726 [Sarcoptes scabiei]|nr:hypothetical protein NH340_JMT06726 [Sarcoptes scabiei]